MIAVVLHLCAIFIMAILAANAWVVATFVCEAITVRRNP